MLRKTLSSSQKTRQQQQALRHRVRNLRAKVKALLPAQICCKYKRRNNNVQKIQLRKDMEHVASSPNFMCLGIHQNQNWFCDQIHQTRKEHMFSKLTTQQIEEIKENKIYYLGQGHIDQFQRFLRKIQSKDQLKLSSKTNPVSKTLLPQSQYNKSARNFSSTQNCTSKVKFSNLLHTIQKQNSTMKSQTFQNFHFRKKKIDQENLAEKLMNKIKLNSKMEKAQSKRTELRMKYLADLRQQSRQMQRRHHTAKMKRMKLSEQGQLVQLNQKIRRLCFKRTNVFTEDQK